MEGKSGGEGGEEMRRTVELNPPGDVLTAENAVGADAAEMAAGSHYDYVGQQWRDGHDHAHFETDSGPLRFCGADLVTCQDGRGCSGSHYASAVYQRNDLSVEVDSSGA